MMKLSFSLIVLSTYAILSATIIKVASTDEQSNGDNEAGEDDWSKFPPKPEHHPFSLNCLLFKDIGCDIDCYAMTNAYGKLGGGACDTNNVCNCTYTENLTLEGLWNEKFVFSNNVLKEIKRNSELSHSVYALLSKPFMTGLQIKEKLKEHLVERDDFYIIVIDHCLAAKMDPKYNRKGLADIKKYVNNILSNELSSNNLKQLSEIHLETTLNKALNDFKEDEKNFKLLVSEIRRIQNESMTLILNNYLTANEKQQSLVNEKDVIKDKDSNDDKTVENNESVEDVAEILSKTIINKMLEKVGKSIFEKIVEWFGDKFSFLTTCTPPTTTDDQVGLRDFDYRYVPDCFKLPSKFDRKQFKTSKPLNKNWNEDTFILRYRRNKEDNINFSWIKSSLMVSIMKLSNGNVNQNWVFGTTVRINMTRTSDGYTAQTWDFGEKTYQYYKIVDSKGEHPHHKWSDGVADDIFLTTYKDYIQLWCTENAFLIEMKYCDIF